MGGPRNQRVVGGGVLLTEGVGIIHKAIDSQAEDMLGLGALHLLSQSARHQLQRLLG